LHQKHTYALSWCKATTVLAHSKWEPC